MKKIYITVVSAIILITGMSLQNNDILCNAKELKEKAKNFLDPYKYDSAELTRIIWPTCAPPSGRTRL